MYLKGYTGEMQLCVLQLLAKPNAEEAWPLYSGDTVVEAAILL